MAEEWRVLIVKTLDGAIVADAIPRDMPSFSRKLNDKGSFTTNFLLGARANSAVDFREYSQIGKYSWIILHGNTPVQGGPAWTYQYTESTRTLSLSGTGIQGYFDKRVMRNPEGHTAIVHPSEDVHYEQEQLWEVLRRLVAYGTIESNYELPILIPDPYAQTPVGQGHKGSYYGYDLAMIWQRMVELSERIGGPEFDFVPEFTNGDNNIQWRLDIGQPKLGDANSNAVWDYGGALSQIDVDVNGSASPLARVWVKGEGTERALRTGFAEDQSLYALGFPPIDFVDSDHVSATVQQTLEDYADQDLQRFRYPVEKWSCRVRIDGRESTYGREVSPRLGTWALGDSPTFFVSGHTWIPDGGYRKRVIGFSSSDDQDSVELEIEEDKSSTSV